jgi:hypothetical protein
MPNNECFFRILEIILSRFAIIFLHQKCPRVAKLNYLGTECAHGKPPRSKYGRMTM